LTGAITFDNFHLLARSEFKQPAAIAEAEFNTDISIENAFGICGTTLYSM
jgi:hypothetical protein